MTENRDAETQHAAERVEDIRDGIRYAKSGTTGNYYLVTEWIDLGEGRIQADEKVPVTEEDVPEHWLEVLNDV